MELLCSKTRSELLALLFDGSGEEYYLREIERLSSVKVNSIQKEIKHLLEIDLIKARKDGNRIYYSANRENPIYPDLVSIVEKTVGIVAILKERLKNSDIKHAFIFGSIAKGKEKSGSDIDLVVIGDLGMRSLTKLLSGIQEKLGREINPHIFSEEEFQKRIKTKDHFVSSILKSEIKMVTGNIDEYKKSN
jgi:predicted nucleotidyltransferase